MKLYEIAKINGKEYPTLMKNKRAILTDLVKRELGIIAWSDRGYVSRKPVKITRKGDKKHA